MGSVDRERSMIDSGRSGRFPLTRVISIGRFRSAAFYMGFFRLVFASFANFVSDPRARRFDAPTGDDDCARSRAAHFARASPPRARPSPSASPARSRSPRVSRTPPLPRRAPRRAARHAPRDGVRHRGERQGKCVADERGDARAGEGRRGAQGRQAPRDARHPRRDARQRLRGRVGTSARASGHPRAERSDPPAPRAPIVRCPPARAPRNRRAPTDDPDDPPTPPAPSSRIASWRVRT